MFIPSGWINKKELYLLFFVFALGVFFRLEYLKDYSAGNIYPLLERSDSYSYFLWAKDISSGELFNGKAFMKWPLYAYFLGFLLKLFKDNVTPVYLIQSIFGAANCLLVYFIGRRIFDKRAGFFAALLCAFYGLFVFYDNLLVYTTLSLLLNSLFLLFILRIENRPRKSNLFWLGIFLGICALTQANIIVFGIPAVLWVLKKDSLSRKKLIGCFLFFVLGLSIVVGLATLKNFLAEKDFVLISGNTGFNFYSGNNPKASGIFSCPLGVGVNQEDMFRDARILAEKESGRRLNTAETSGFWFKKAFSFIKEEPAAYAGLFLKKIALVFSPREFVHDMEYSFIAPRARIFKVMLMDLKFILPLAVLGAVLGFRKYKEIRILYIALMTLSLSTALFFVTARYRLVIVPYLAILAGLTLSNAWEALKKKDFLRLGLLCAGFVVFFFVLNYSAGYLADKNSDRSETEFEYRIFNAMDYKNSFDYGNALRQLELARKVKPDNYAALLKLGEIHFRMGNINESEREFLGAVMASSIPVDAYYNLGLIYNRQFRFEEAKGVLIKALSLDPENIEAHFELGLACKSLKEDMRAKQEFTAALMKINRWRVAEQEAIQKELNSLKAKGSGCG